MYPTFQNRDSFTKEPMLLGLCLGAFAPAIPSAQNPLFVLSAWQMYLSIYKYCSKSMVSKKTFPSIQGTSYSMLYIHLFLQQMFTEHRLDREYEDRQDLAQPWRAHGMKWDSKRYKTAYRTCFFLCITTPHTCLLGTSCFSLPQPCLTRD